MLNKILFVILSVSVIPVVAMDSPQQDLKSLMKAPNHIKVKIKDQDLLIRIKDDSTAADVKQTIFDKTGIPVADQESLSPIAKNWTTFWFDMPKSRLNDQDNIKRAMRTHNTKHFLLRTRTAIPERNKAILEAR